MESVRNAVPIDSASCKISIPPVNKAAVSSND
nr:MAG TPA: hypothetical protein [Caudoviricetes sp.]DAZ75027.1 MAG TPA: hypothetical protein [Caudoviricetes sp.]